jgi:threonine aldolase
MEPLIAEYKKAFLNCTHQTARNRANSLKQTFQALANATDEDELADVYGSGDVITDFEEEIAKLLGKERAVFLPSGTMAQPIALKVWADRSGRPYVAMHATSHLQLHEHNAFQTLYNLKGVTVGNVHQVPSLDDIRAAAHDPLAAILWELPMREIGGQLPKWDDLVEQTHWAQKQGIRCHMDGARLWQCTEYYLKTLADISALFDSVYVSFYKDLGGISGAVLAGDEAFIDSAKIWIRRAGGNLYSLAPYVVAAREGLKQHFPDIPNRVKQAQWLATQFNNAEGMSTWPLEPQTNMFRLRIHTSPKEFLAKAATWMTENKVAVITPPYEMGEDYCLSELTIGDAFGELTEEQWSKHINSFLANCL